MHSVQVYGNMDESITPLPPTSSRVCPSRIGGLPDPWWLEQRSRQLVQSECITANNPGKLVYSFPQRPEHITPTNWPGSFMCSFVHKDPTAAQVQTVHSPPSSEPANFCLVQASFASFISFSLPCTACVILCSSYADWRVRRWRNPYKIPKVRAE